MIIVLAFSFLGSLAGISSPAAAQKGVAAPKIPQSVVINEVAWMGTLANPGAEWIELYNKTSMPINLDGWILRAKSGPLNIELKGTIGKGEFFLIDREINGHGAFLKIPADLSYSGAMMSDQGEQLLLLNSNNTVMDTANIDGGAWPAGKIYNYNYCSMERAGYNLPDIPSSWITNDYIHSNGEDTDGNRICGTPGKQNWAYSVTPTFTPTKTPVTPTRTPYFYYTSTPRATYTPTVDVNKLPSSVVINEFLPMPRADYNHDGVIDAGDGFIEIKNLSTLEISLSGWRLDDQEGDSTPYSLGSISLKGGASMVFFNSTTGIFLGNGGDSVRLFKANGRISDAFTYGVDQTPDRSWCRIPDGNGSWLFGCIPTPGGTNSFEKSTSNNILPESAFCRAASIPAVVKEAECDLPGLSAWNPALWRDSRKYPLYWDEGQDIYILN